MKKNLKKGLAIILAGIMMLGALPAIAFAETAQVPNFEAEVDLDNYDCKEFESFKELSELPLTLTITSEADPAETVSFELEYDEEYECFWIEAYDDSAQMTAIMEQLLKNEDAVKDAWLNADYSDENYFAVIFDGYTVTLNLGEDSHWTAELCDGWVTSNTEAVWEFEATVAFMIAGYNELAELFGEPPIVLTEEEKPKTYEELALFLENLGSETQYDSYEEALRSYADELEYTEEDIQMMLEEVRKQDEALAAARAETETYPTDFWVFMLLFCDCPFMIDYEITHQYLVEKDGKLEEIDFLWEEDFWEDEDAYLCDEEGTVIRGEDFRRDVYKGEIPEYAGKTFTYVGSYDEEALWELDSDEDYSSYAMDQFVLNRDLEPYGLVLRYVLKEDTTVEPIDPGEDDKTPSNGENTVPTDDDKVKQPAAVETEKAASAPETGDHTPIGIYIALLVTAVCAVIVLLALKKIKK